MDVLAARTELVRRYLAAFGPSTRADIADWSGLRVGGLRRGARRRSSLCVAARDENGRELLDLPRAPLPSRRHARVRSASCRSGTTRCSRTPTGGASCPKSCARP